MILTSFIAGSRKLLRRRRELKYSRILERCLEALAVDDGRTALIVFLLGDPHLLEG